MAAKHDLNTSILACSSHVFALHLQSDTRVYTCQDLSKSHMHALAVKNGAAIKVNSEMYDFELRYFLATDEWQQRG